MKIIIAGGRNFFDLGTLKTVFVNIASHVKNEDITIISGGAKGADKTGEYLQSMLKGSKLEVYPALWDKYGKSAGYVRNAQMITEGKAEYLLAAWDGKSKGTKSMIELAKKHNIPTVILEY